MPLYTQDGVFMPQHFQSSQGSAAVRAVYDNVFAAIQLSVKFAIVEIPQIAPDWAIARTNSAGTVPVHANGASSAEASQDLLVVQKLDASWKIVRYCFSTTNPPRF